MCTFLHLVPVLWEPGEVLALCSEVVMFLDVLAGDPVAGSEGPIPGSCGDGVEHMSGWACWWSCG